MVPDELNSIVRDFLDLTKQYNTGDILLLPLSESAFKYYDYKLLKTYIDNDKQFLKSSNTTFQTEPLFREILQLQIQLF